ncbi:DUF4127 family protein [Halobacillus kuroshimensis]|uniref:DUF4127 family protein n=1 Tax=Halobacillus kuroshimensis TaxID=302481 RepID=UPI00146D960C|nr:DUF4127 family protein [Halobacillus kuroshimensis]
MRRKIALLPVDGRPVTRKLPIDMARIADWEVIAPSVEELGFLKRPADTDSLEKWLINMASQVDGVILSMDMLLYGGLVPSRIHPYTEQRLLRKLAILKQVKEYAPSLKIMVFSSTMRMSNNNINEEEKEYWKDYGRAIWSLSYHEHRFEKLGEQEDAHMVEEMKGLIPEEVLEDYKNARAVNFSVNRQLVNEVKEGWIDHLVFPQDDTSEYGWNVKEQELLRETAREQGVDDSVFLYPGADEVAVTLLTRMIFELEEADVPVFYPVYSGIAGALSRAMYEDRPIMESVKGQIYAIGSRTEEDLTYADVVIGVNVPGHRQGDLALSLHLNQVDTNHRNVPEWLSRLRSYMKRRPVAIADVAYANGADPRLFPLLFKQLNWRNLYAFAAWNTAGNTLGTVVSQAALSWLSEKSGLERQKHREGILVERFLDDYVYQSVVRKEGRKRLDVQPSESLQTVVTPVFEGRASQLLDDWAQEYELTDVHYPWNRTFEIGFRCVRKEGES